LGGSYAFALDNPKDRGQAKEDIWGYLDAMMIIIKIGFFIGPALVRLWGDYRGVTMYTYGDNLNFISILIVKEYPLRNPKVLPIT